MPIGQYVFRTHRLAVDEWRRAGGSGLAEAVSTLLTPAVTDQLPPGWQGTYDIARAERWIAERDREATTLLATSLASDAAVGLVLLHEEPAPELPYIEIRLGYLVAELAWGKGFGVELVGGFVDWARQQRHISALVGGVAPTNIASIRILERHGFRQVASEGGHDREMEYRLSLRP